jgi:uncharacterized membrane protein YhaH (DUF805 family)
MSDTGEQTRQKAADEKFCPSCGAIIKQAAEICPKCGVRQTSGINAAFLKNETLKTAFNYVNTVLTKYIVFSGRARRAEFWWFTLAYALGGTVVIILSTIPFIGDILYAVYFLGLFVPALAVAWRRMHDVGKPGGYCFIPIYSIILAATAGQPGANQYGPDPKETETSGAAG